MKSDEQVNVSVKGHVSAVEVGRFGKIELASLAKMDSLQLLHSFYHVANKVAESSTTVIVHQVVLTLSVKSILLLTTIHQLLTSK